ncbi:MAG TPA: formylglycine-generating enzyme family protein, partial [Polyangiaceae bacterium]|nr:formylglycine-generating enzyme family protein [Polyangiaceae bacterium]
MKPALLLRLSFTLSPLLLAAPGQSQPAPAEMLKVPGGTFTMGADGVGEGDEQPAHPVSVKGFWLDRTEVTNARYAECVQAGKCAPYRDDVARRFGAGPEAGFRSPEQPVVGISAIDAGNYCAFRGLRLPREAEWERAARGDDQRTFAWGNQKPTPELACYGRKPGAKGATTDPVGSHP